MAEGLPALAQSQHGGSFDAAVFGWSVTTLGCRWKQKPKEFLISLLLSHESAGLGRPLKFLPNILYVCVLCVCVLGVCT